MNPAGRGLLAGTGLLLAVGPARTVAQVDTASELPVVAITGPTVIAFWTVPESDSVLMADPGLASALDQQQTYWADTRDRLEGLGIRALDQPGRRFRVRDGDRVRLFEAAPDSAVIGYVLAAPGRAFRVLYRLWYPGDLLEAATAHFSGPQRRPQRPQRAAGMGTS